MALRLERWLSFIVSFILKELSSTDRMDVYNMLWAIGPGENGFINDGFVEPDCFAAFLKKYIDLSNGINLESDQVPQTMYWLYVDDRPVGYGKLRHCLNDRLRRIGGHIGLYFVRNLALMPLLNRLKGILNSGMPAA